MRPGPGDECHSGGGRPTRLPTSANMQPLRVFLMRSDDARERVLKHLSDRDRDKWTNAPLIAMLAAKNGIHRSPATCLPTQPGFKARVHRRREARADRPARFNAALQIG